MVCFRENAVALRSAVVEQINARVSQDIQLVDDVRVHEVVVVEPVTREISSALIREIDQLILTNLPSPSRYLFLGILIDFPEGAATRLVGDDEVARRPIIFEEMMAGGGLDEIGELVERVMMSIGAGLAFAAENPGFSLSGADALPPRRESKKDSTADDPISFAPESLEPLSPTERLSAPETPPSHGPIQNLLGAASSMRGRRAINAAKARTKMATFDEMATHTRVSCLYVVEVAGSGTSRGVRKRQSDLLLLVAESVAERQDGPWFYSIISSDRTTLRRSGPKPVSKLMLEKAGSRAGFDFSLGSCSEQLIELIFGDRQALERRGAEIVDVYVIFLAVEPPLMSAAATDAHRELCEAINGCAWILFGKSETSIPDDLWTDGSLVLGEHEDIAEELLQKFFVTPEVAGRSHRAEDDSYSKPDIDVLMDPDVEIRDLGEALPPESIAGHTRVSEER
jgi:hypothetical protein